jgi:hypothetical protein
VYSDTLFSHVDTFAMLGHYHLWVGGVEHNDVSVKNLMYDKRNGDCGVLNDYDLAHLDGRSRPSGTERTGTMPFMALDLLTDEAWEGKITRLYRHDCESFAWVLLWICCRYEDGKEIPNPPLGQFITGSYNQCFEKKRPIISRLKHLTATSSYDSFWFAVVGLLDLFIMQQLDRERAALPGQSSLCIPPQALLRMSELLFFSVVFFSDDAHMHSLVQCFRTHEVLIAIQRRTKIPKQQITHRTENVNFKPRTQDRKTQQQARSQVL